MYLCVRGCLCVYAYACRSNLLLMTRSSLRLLEVTFPATANHSHSCISGCERQSNALCPTSVFLNFIAEDDPVKEPSNRAEMISWSIWPRKSINNIKSFKSSYYVKMPNKRWFLLLKCEDFCHFYITVNWLHFGFELFVTLPWALFSIFWCFIDQKIWINGVNNQQMNP